LLYAYQLKKFFFSIYDIKETVSLASLQGSFFYPTTYVNLVNAKLRYITLRLSNFNLWNMAYINQLTLNVTIKCSFIFLCIIPLTMIRCSKSEACVRNPSQTMRIFCPGFPLQITQHEEFAKITVGCLIKSYTFPHNKGQ
jgi:hypothetical protein